MRGGRGAAAWAVVFGVAFGVATGPAAAALAGGARVPIDQVVTDACTGEPVALEGTADVLLTMDPGDAHALRTRFADVVATGRGTGTRWRMANAATVVTHGSGRVGAVDQDFTLTLAREEGPGELVVDVSLHFVIDGRRVKATLGPAFAACDGGAASAAP